MAKDKAPATCGTDRFALPINPVENIVLRMRAMKTGNGVTSRGSLGGGSPHGEGANRMPRERKMPEEAKARGNARDMLTSGRYSER